MKIEITPQEAACLINVINNISIPLSADDAVQTVTLMSSVRAKAIEVLKVEQQKPLASAAKKE